MNQIIKIEPEHLDVANTYLQFNSIQETANTLGITPERVDSILQKREVKRYIDNMYLNQGYRNRHRLGALLDQLIESKLEEAAQSGIYTTKDLAELISLAHKIRTDEIKSNKEETTNNNINVTNNYSSLMDKLLNGGGSIIPG